MGSPPATSAEGLRQSAQDVLTQLPPKRRQRIVLELEGEAAAEAEGTMADLREMWDKQPDKNRRNAAANFSLFKGWKQAGLAKARGRSRLGTGRSHLGSPARKHAPSVDTAGRVERGGRVLTHDRATLQGPCRWRWCGRM